jgi:hypothetical protein
VALKFKLKIKQLQHVVSSGDKMREFKHYMGNISKKNYRGLKQNSPSFKGINPINPIIYRYEKKKKFQVHKQKEYKKVITPKDPQNTTFLTIFL